MMTTKLATNFDYDKFAKDLANIRASLTTDGSVDGVVSNNVAPEAVQDAMNKVMKLIINNYGSSVSRAVLEAKSDRGIVNTETAMSVLRGQCFKDLKNAEYADNVNDSLALQKVADSAKSFYVINSNHIYNLTASDVLEVISDIAFNDDFITNVKRHSIHAYKVISQL